MNYLSASSVSSLIVEVGFIGKPIRRLQQFSAIFLSRFIQSQLQFNEDIKQEGDCMMAFFRLYETENCLDKH